MRTLSARVATKYIKTSADNLSLHLYDFDNCLFRSPDPPKWWLNKKMGFWFDLPESLSEPFVPTKPSPDYWFNSTVYDAKVSISDLNTLAIMCTGRCNGNAAMRYRIAELLKGKGLDFDEVHLRTGGKTNQYKAKVVFDLLKKHPNITSVEVWEDTQANLDSIEKVCDAVGVDFVPHLVIPNPYPIDDITKEDYLLMSKLSHR